MVNAPHHKEQEKAAVLLHFYFLSSQREPLPHFHLSPGVPSESSVHNPLPEYLSERRSLRKGLLQPELAGSSRRTFRRRESSRATLAGTLQAPCNAPKRSLNSELHPAAERSPPARLDHQMTTSKIIISIFCFNSEKKEELR